MSLTVNTQDHTPSQQPTPPRQPRLPGDEADPMEVIPRIQQIFRQRAGIIFYTAVLVIATEMTWKIWHYDSDLFDRDPSYHKKIWMCVAIIALEQIFLCIRM